MVTLLNCILLMASLKIGRANEVNLFPEGMANEFTAMFSNSPNYTGGPIHVELCPSTPNCVFDTPFRKISGECNNIQHRRWGAAVLPLRRLIPRENEKFRLPVYLEKPAPYNLSTSPLNCPSDCGNQFDGCQTNTQKLPSARLASSTLSPDKNRQEERYSNMLMQFSQFLDHDITLSPETEVEDCCHSTNPECMPIDVPRNDSFYSKFGVECLPFTRSEPFCPQENKTRENFNAITAFLDASMVYGSDEKLASSLRSYSSGKLRVNYENNLLPRKPDGDVLAGDVRASVVPGLVSLHAIFVREHNRLCDLLKRKNFSDCSDENLYQNAKRILTAEWQKIVIEDYLPLILGNSTVNDFGLKLQDEGTSYNKSIDPSIFAVFSGAAFRFGHTLVPGIFNMKNTSFTVTDHHFKPEMYEHNMKDILYGLTSQPCQHFDRFITNQLRNHLFKNNASFGEDLIARNIQRGRDHGIPSYSEFYKLLGPSSDPNIDMSCWARRPQSFTCDMWDKLKSVYLHPHDIDMFLGGLMETVTGDALVGDTFKTIIARQFKNIMYGDRFFFTHQGQVDSFDKEAIKAIRKRNLRDIICDNTDIKQLPRNVFLRHDPVTNPLTLCLKSSADYLEKVHFFINGIKTGPGGVPPIV